MIDSQNLRIINPVRNFGSGALYDNTTFDSCLIFYWLNIHSMTSYSDGCVPLCRYQCSDVDAVCVCIHVCR